MSHDDSETECSLSRQIKQLARRDRLHVVVIQNRVMYKICDAIALCLFARLRIMGCFSQQEVHAELEESGKRIRDSQTQTHFVQNIPEGFISRSQVPKDIRHGMEMGARMEDEPIQNPADVCHEFITASVTVRVVIAVKNAPGGVSAREPLSW